VEDGIREENSVDVREEDIKRFDINKNKKMAKGTPAKVNRNKKLVELKKAMSFKKLAAVFQISETRAKQIYYREVKKK